jgi:hypothetical protein
MKLVPTLSLLMLIFALVACGGKAKTTDTKDTKDSTTTENDPKEVKKEADILGEWSLVSVNGTEQSSMNITFDNSGNITMVYPESTTKGTYTKSGDGKTILIKTSDTEEDSWEIKSISETELVLLDADPKNPKVISEYVFKR